MCLLADTFRHIQTYIDMVDICKMQNTVGSDNIIIYKTSILILDSMSLIPFYILHIDKNDDSPSPSFPVLRGLVETKVYVSL